jgi:Flp pilus assembly protein TadD
LKQFPLAAMGWVHYKRHEFDEAISCLSRSSELEPAEKTLTHLGIALLAAGEEERARSILAEARDLGPQGGSLEQRMMECMKDSDRLFERVQQGHES